MKKFYKLLIAFFVLLCITGITSFAEEYPDALTLTDAEAEFFELTDDEIASFGPKKHKGYKIYELPVNIVEPLSLGGNINEIMARCYSEKNLILYTNIITINATNNSI